MKNSMIIFFISFFFNMGIFPWETLATVDLKYASPSLGGGVFGGNDDCGRTISLRIQNDNTQSVHVSMYTLTSLELKRKMEEKAAAGKKVCILVDQYQYKNCKSGDEYIMKARINELANHASSNIKVRLLGSDEPNTNMMHEKVAILSAANGRHTVVLGSYNWTYSASKDHFENCIFLNVGQGSPTVNQAAILEKGRFDNLWRRSRSAHGDEREDLDCLFNPTDEEKAKIAVVAYHPSV